jgi:hypothetical protein
MSTSNFGRVALTGCVTAAMLAACGGSQPPTIASGGLQETSPAHRQAFGFTGKAQSYTVPSYLTKITVVAIGAQGGGSTGAFGGRARAVIPVTGGEVLKVYVGGEGSHTEGGFNGGGGAGTSCGEGCGYGGGGASDIRQGGDKLSDRIVVAAGGGGEGADYYGNNGGAGGKGGGKSGGSGEIGQSGYFGDGGDGGMGGKQRHGGSGGSGGSGSTGTGAPGSSGSLGSGGAGGQGCATTSCVFGGDGGGGGAGYYGGGGGGAGGGDGGSTQPAGGGGGGGSSYAEPNALHAYISGGVKTKTGNGLVVFSW